jgi:putative sterol carrier protein
VVYIDGNANPPSVSNDDKAADCTLKMAFSDFDDMINGKLDGMTAFMTGKLKIEGDMGVAMKLQTILR